MYIEGLDEVDNKILTILENDGRASYSEIGEQVELSRVAVKNRIQNLEEIGVITGYKAVINSTNHEEGTLFFIDIVTRPAAFNEIVDYLGSHGIIRKVYAVTGESRIHAEGFALSKKRYEMFYIGLKELGDKMISCTIQGAIHTIKDADRGIKYEAKSADNNGDTES